MTYLIKYLTFLTNLQEFQKIFKTKLKNSYLTLLFNLINYILIMTSMYYFIRNIF